jgi:hypothetical protein
MGVFRDSRGIKEVPCPALCRAGASAGASKKKKKKKGGGDGGGAQDDADIAERLQRWGLTIERT